MGKYSFEDDNRKPANKFLLFFVTPLLCLISQAIIVVALMAALRGFEIEDNLLSPLPIIFIGLGLFIFYGIIEVLIRKKRKLGKFSFILSAYILPVIIWGISAVISVSKWWSDRNNEDIIFAKWFTITLLIYVSVAFAYRFVVFVISIIIDRKAEEK